MDSLKNEGSDHYRTFVIQPAEYILRNNLDFPTGNVIKYATRYVNTKNPKDLAKAMHYLKMIQERDSGVEECVSQSKATSVAIAPRRSLSEAMELPAPLGEKPCGR